MTRSTKITIQTESLMVLRGITGSRSWCCQCAQEVDRIAVGSIGVISNLLPYEVEEWLNSPDLHRSQTPDGEELICLNSLLASIRKTTARSPCGPETVRTEKEEK